MEGGSNNGGNGSSSTKGKAVTKRKRRLTSSMSSPKITASPSSSSISNSPDPLLSTTPTSQIGRSAKTRMKGVVIEKSICYGNIAWWLGPKADEQHTHRWTAYVRGPNNQDLSYFIKKVVFSLHPSFPNPVRVVEKPPFEITETGWGEFELAIRIYFVDPLEHPVDLYHGLVLYPPEGQAALSTKKPVVKENYDEIVFNDPTEYFYQVLKFHESNSTTTSPHPLALVRGSRGQAPVPPSEKELKELLQINQARTVVREEIIRLKDNYDNQDNQCRILREEIKQMSELLDEANKRRRLQHIQHMQQIQAVESQSQQQQSQLLDSSAPSPFSPPSTSTSSPSVSVSAVPE
jgi:YEATS domain-containing protein 4